MTNQDMTTWAPNAEVEATPSTLNPQVAALGEWAQAASATQQVASALVQSSFVPQAFKGKPIEATAAILAGAEIGLQPMTALKAFDVIQGAAAPRAMTLRAVVQSAGHEVVTVESTATRCRMKGRRRGSDTWQQVDWTIDRAKQLGVTGKDNWRKQPQAMLVARATSELCRLIAADAILGIGYSVEEIADGGDGVSVADLDAAPVEAPVKRTLRRTPPKPLAVPDPEPEAEPAPKPEAEPAPEPGPEPITKAQLTALNAGLTALVGSDRAAKLEWLTYNLNREITSSKDVTKDEASKLIDYFNSAPQQDSLEAGEPA